jgi:hypothetical protein
MTRIFTSALGLALAASTLWAQEPPTDPLYKVELLIFSYRSPAAGASEAWEPTPRLSYPDPARFLLNPPRIRAMAAEFGDNSEIDTYGRQLITTASKRPDAPSPEPADSITEPATIITPFEVLDNTELELAAGAGGLQRSGRYDVLFHQAWVQPLRQRDSALPIILDQSGDSGDWPALQGSVKFYLSRYLHLETRLWLNTRGDYLPGRWWMPAPPLSPPSVMVDGQPPYIARLGEAETSASDRNPAPAPYHTDPFRPIGPESQGPGPADTQPWEPPWSYRHSVLLQQTRRMRSEEVHYLDHPMLGLVVKLTPVESVELSDGIDPDT